MTSEVRTTIQLSDIRTVEFECLHCHSRIVRPVGGTQPLMLGCPECGDNWAHYRGDMEVLTRLASQLAKLSGIDDPKNEAPFIVRFEISTDKKP